MIKSRSRGFSRSRGRRNGMTFRETTVYGKISAKYRRSV